MPRKVILSSKNFRQQGTSEDVLRVATEMHTHERALYAEGEDEYGMGTIRMNGFKALLRADGTPYMAVPTTFQPKQHEEIFSSVISELDKTGLNYYPVALTANDGPKRNSLLVRFAFPDLNFDSIGSETLACLTISNGNDLQTTFSAGFGFWRLVCTNGLVVQTKSLMAIRKKHTQGISKVQLGDYVYDSLDAIRQEIPIFQNLLDKAATIPVTEHSNYLLQNSLKLSDNFMLELPIMSVKYQLAMNEPYDINTILGQYQVLTNYFTNRVEPRDVGAAALSGLKLNQWITTSVEDVL